MIEDINKTNKNNIYNDVPCHFPSETYNSNYLNEIEDAVTNKKAYNTIRIGDSEIIFLQQEYIYPINYLTTNVPWASGVGYNGSCLPNLELRDRMIESIKYSSSVGIFKGDPVMEQVFQKIGLYPQSTFYSFDNLAMPMSYKFINLLIEFPPLLVGQHSPKYAEYFKEHLGIDVVGCVKINEYAEIETCMDKMSQYDYRWALVSAGANAKIITYEMKLRKPAVYLDMGHYMDNVLAPSYKDYWLICKWMKNKIYQPSQQVLYNKILYKCISKTPLQSHITPDVDKCNWVLW